MRFFLFGAFVFLWTEAALAFVPTARQVELFDIAVEQFQNRMEQGAIARIYETADPSFQVAVSKAEFLRVWDNHQRDFGTAGIWNVSETFWYDQGAQGIFAVSELQFLTDANFVGCGYLVFKESGTLGFLFLRSDTLFIPAELASQAQRDLYAHIEKAPGCAGALDVFE